MSRSVGETAARRALAIALGAVLALGGLGACAAGDEGDEPSATCDREGCTDISVEQIEEISGLDLPEGTEVLESSYTAFQDWHLSATLLLPEGAEDPILASEDAWDGQVDDEGITRSVESRLLDGRLELVIGVFTM